MTLINFKRRLILNTAIVVGALSLLSLIMPAVGTSPASGPNSGNSASKTKATSSLPSYPAANSDQRVGQAATYDAQNTPTSQSASLQPAPNDINSQTSTSLDPSTNNAPIAPSAPVQDTNGDSSSDSSTCINYSCTISKHPSPPTTCGCGVRPLDPRVSTNIMCPMTACFE